MSFNRLLSDRSGSTAMIYALTVLPVVAVIAGALDFSARENLERKLKSATDAAAIAAIRYAIEGGLDADADTAAIILAAKDSFQSNIEGLDAGFDIDPVVEVDEDEGITVTARFDYPTSMLSIIGIQDLGVKARSRAAYQAGTAIEAVLVLDNSFSMDGARMDSLRDAADEFLDTVMTVDNDAVKIAVVPFNNYVNVGLDRGMESWIDVPSDYSQPVSSCAAPDADYVDAGCMRVSCSYSSDYDCTEWSCPTGVTVTPTCTTTTADFSWRGCVESRARPLDYEDRDFSSNPEKGRMERHAWGCPAPILPLTSDRGDIDDRLDAMVPEADTYIAPGIAWGLRVLSSQEPFSEGADAATFADEGGTKVMILMSDGENTRSRNSYGVEWGDHWASDVADANATTLAACEYAKAQGVEIYTVAFGVTDADTLAILEDCASNIEQFYNTIDAIDLSGAFADIGRSFRDIALVE
jgi:Mg-chelatase subunit ChlD